jgi:AraC-like DNA-binding protein
MPFVTSIFARRVVEAAGSAVDGRAELRAIGVDPDAPFDVAQMVPAGDYYHLLERVASAIPDGHRLPLRVGPAMRPDDYGALGLAWKSAPTVRGSLERVARYCRVWTDVMTYELRDADAGGAHFVLHRHGDRRLGLRLSNECTVASAVSLIRQTALPAFRPRAVSFQHAAPAITADHEQHFGCPVQWGARLDAVTIADADLGAPNQLGDDGISRFLLTHLDAEVARLTGADSLADAVRRLLSRSLSEGVPRMADIARMLGAGERTLHRRLAEEGLTFRRLLDATRQELAQNLLGQSAYSMAEVAFLTGFSEQSAFQRAFKRWTGRTPAAYRSAQSA